MPTVLNKTHLFLPVFSCSLLPLFIYMDIFASSWRGSLPDVPPRKGGRFGYGGIFTDVQNNMYTYMYHRPPADASFSLKFTDEKYPSQRRRGGGGQRYCKFEKKEKGTEHEITNGNGC
jgi:hypothetical protein